MTKCLLTTILFLSITGFCLAQKYDKFLKDFKYNSATSRYQIDNSTCLASFSLKNTIGELLAYFPYENFERFAKVEKVKEDDNHTILFYHTSFNFNWFVFEKVQQGTILHIITSNSLDTTLTDDIKRNLIDHKGKHSHPFDKIKTFESPITEEPFRKIIFDNSYVDTDWVDLAFVQLH